MTEAANNNMYTIRKEKRISADEMAERLSICTQTYYKYEREPSSCSVGCAFKICEILGKSFSEIFGEVKK